MRKLALATTVAASAILAAPAAARDGAFYAGIEGGIMLVEDSKMDYADVSGDADEAVVVDHGRGYDVGLLGGYDFGAFRLEAEAAYKRASVQEIYFDPSADIVPVGENGVNDADGRVRVTSGMVNALLDFGDEGVTGFAGVGAGLARVQYRAFSDDGNGFAASDNALAWQALAGVRFPLSPNLDAGLKYRFFSTRRLNFDVGDATVPFELGTRFRSHSLLASLVYNFAAPVAPLPPVVETPPPPPPPATQTCPDGSVVLATDVCPVPPPPPPPPPPTEERG